MPTNDLSCRNEVAISVENKLGHIKSLARSIYRNFSTLDMTGCERKLLWQIGGSGHDLPHSKMELYSENSVRNKWFGILKNTVGIKLLDSNITVSDPKYNIAGVVDCVIETEELQLVVYIKSVPSNVYYEIIKNGATRKDIVKTTLDMWLIEIANAIIIYENRDTFDFHVLSVVPHDGIINSIKSKIDHMMEGIRDGILPDRPYDNRNASECKICPFLKGCW